MYYFNSTLKATHPYSSKWYQWPVDDKPIWYWEKNAPGKTANIYLFGNPLLWLAILAGVIFSVLTLFVKEIRQKLPPLFYALLFGYFLNLLAYIFIARIAFLYHYLPSVVFGILMLAILYEKIIAPAIVEKSGKKAEFTLYVGFLLSCLIVFLALCPINYGFFVPVQSQWHNFYLAFIKFLS